MVKSLLVIFAMALTMMVSPSSYAYAGDVGIQYYFANFGDKPLDISVDGAKLNGFLPKEASTNQTGGVEWHALRGVTTGFARFQRRSTFQICVGGVKSDREVIFADDVRFIRIEIDQHSDIKITLLNALQDLD